MEFNAFCFYERMKGYFKISVLPGTWVLWQYTFDKFSFKNGEKKGR
jgi:hypothetical protein